VAETNVAHALFLIVVIAAPNVFAKNASACRVAHMHCFGVLCSGCL